MRFLTKPNGFALALALILAGIGQADGNLVAGSLSHQQYCYQTCGCGGSSVAGMGNGGYGGGWQMGNNNNYGNSFGSGGYGSSYGGWQMGNNGYGNSFGSGGGGGGGWLMGGGYGKLYGSGSYGGSSGGTIKRPSWLKKQNWSPSSSSSLFKLPNKMTPVLVNPSKKLTPQDGFILIGKTKKAKGSDYASAGGTGKGNKAATSSYSASAGGAGKGNKGATSSHSASGGGHAKGQAAGTSTHSKTASSKVNEVEPKVSIDLKQSE